MSLRLVGVVSSPNRSGPLFDFVMPLFFNKLAPFVLRLIIMGVCWWLSCVTPLSTVWSFLGWCMRLFQLLLDLLFGKVLLWLMRFHSLLKEKAARRKKPSKISNDVEKDLWNFGTYFIYHYWLIHPSMSVNLYICVLPLACELNLDLKAIKSRLAFISAKLSP